METQVILRTWDDTEAELVRALLESYGIPCWVSSQITHAVYPLTVNGLGEIKVNVPVEAAEEARRILEDHRSGQALQNPTIEPD